MTIEVPGSESLRDSEGQQGDNSLAASTEQAGGEQGAPASPTPVAEGEVAPIDDVDSDVDDDDDDEGDAEYQGHAEPLEIDEELTRDEEIELKWYILKVASNRENSIADALRRRVKVEGLDDYFGQVIVPTEDVAEFKNGKKRIVKRKLYPGYICVQLHFNDDTWFLVRDTPGIGDFTGAAGKPTPMLDQDVSRILPKPKGEEEEKVKIGIPFKVADRVRIKEGTFENFEGDVEAIDEANGRVTVVINIFDRPTPVEIDHWQLESV